MYWHASFQFLTRSNLQTSVLILLFSIIFTACQSSPKQPKNNDSQQTTKEKKPLNININLSQPTPTPQPTNAIPSPAVTTASSSVTEISTKNIDQRRLQLSLSMEQQGYIVLSNQLLNEINIDNLPESLWGDYYESLASTNQSLGFDSVVLNWLEKANAAGSLNDIDARERRLSIAVKAYQTNEQYLAATKAAIELIKLSSSTSLTNEEKQLQNDRLWFLLTQPQVADLNALTETNDIVVNWLELAKIFYKQTNVANAQAEIKDWLSLHPTHPATQHPPIDLVKLLSFSPKRIEKVAVILPTSGALKEIGQAILDGMMINLYQQQNRCIASCDSLPTLTLFNSQDIKDWQQQYQLLADQGFDLVVGPLDKNKVEKAWQVQQKAMPTLALNYLPEQTTQNNGLTTSLFLQFGLSLEEEARQIAHQNKNKTYKNVLIAHSNEPWAQRASQSFIDEWIQTGGVVSGKLTIDGEQNYSELVKQSLHINASNNRRKNIQNIIGQNVSFETRRRQDIDAIILFSQPKPARQLIPTIAFHHGADIPIYASHHVYQGATNSSRDIDLDGLIFTDIPWILEKNQTREQALSTWPQRDSYNRLFALGADAYTLINEVEALSILPSMRLIGTTGQLLHANGKIWGKLTWAQFNNGRPKVINYPNELQ